MDTASAPPIHTSSAECPEVPGDVHAAYARQLSSPTEPRLNTTAELIGPGTGDQRWKPWSTAGNVSAEGHARRQKRIGDPKGPPIRDHASRLERARIHVAGRDAVDVEAVGAGIRASRNLLDEETDQVSRACRWIMVDIGIIGHEHRRGGIQGLLVGVATSDL